MKLDIKGRIKLVKRIEKGIYGDTLLTPSTFTIRISEEENKQINEFCGTLLHELLHVWFGIIKEISVTHISKKLEHEIIHYIESIAVYLTHSKIKEKLKKSLTKI